MSYRATLDPTGHRVRIGGEGTARRVVLESIKAALPDARPKRVDGHLTVSVAEFEELAATPFPVETDKATQRMLDNRRHVSDNALRVIAECRAIAAAGPVEARARISDCSLVGMLDDHQAINVATMVVPGGWGTCVFDEQGTGKTISVVAAYDTLVERGEAETLLVVAPKSMIAEWGAEFARFTGSLYQVSVADGTRADRGRAINSGADVIVVNYETVGVLADSLRLLAERSRTVLVVDESFLVKNPDAQRTQAVRALREWCTRCYVLCGTPAPNTPHDLVAQVDLVDFGHTFSGARIDDDRELARDQVRQILDARGFYLRNLKGTVLPHLPERRFLQVPIEMSPRQRQVYDTLRDELVLELKDVTDTEFQRNVTHFLERRALLLRVCSDPTPVLGERYDEVPAKLEAMDALLTSVVHERNEKVVIWSFYRASLDRIAERYRALGVARIDGSVTSTDERRDAVRRFQSDGSTMLFLGNPAAAGAGLTLHKARIAIYESMSNQAAHYLQSLDRIHRRGQEREVEYVHLLAIDSIEEPEYQRLLDKADRQSELLRDAGQPRVTRSMLLADLLTEEVESP